MLSANVIERYFAAGRHELLLDALAANGLDLPLPLKVRLAEHPAAAVAMGLRRVIELTYGPTPLSRGMTDCLCGQAEGEGGFAGDPLAAAAVAAALGRVLGDQPADDGHAGPARQRALEALATLQEDDGLFRCPNDRTEQDRALAGAFILLLLGGDAEFRGAVRFADLVDWFESRYDSLEPATRRFFRMARSGVAAREMAQTAHDLVAA